MSTSKTPDDVESPRNIAHGNLSPSLTDFEEISIESDSEECTKSTVYEVNRRNSHRREMHASDFRCRCAFFSGTVFGILLWIVVQRHIIIE